MSLTTLNGQLDPKSAEIDVPIGEQPRQRGDTARAIERDTAALAKAPQHPVAT